MFRVGGSSLNVSSGSSSGPACLTSAPAQETRKPPLPSRRKSTTPAIMGTSGMTPIPAGSPSRGSMQQAGRAGFWGLGSQGAGHRFLGFSGMMRFQTVSEIEAPKSALQENPGTAHMRSRCNTFGYELHGPRSPCKPCIPRS